MEHPSRTTKSNSSADKSDEQKKYRSTKHLALDHALRYAKEGIRAIWIPRGTKAPIETAWPEKATTKAAVIKGWAADHLRCNFGLVMGNGFITIDVDEPGAIRKLNTQGLELPKTRCHQTPGGGLHFIYRTTTKATIKNFVRILPGVDIRYQNGQIVSPGSIHPNGGVYQIVEDAPIAKLPQAWLTKLTETTHRQAAPRTVDGVIPEHQRNVTMIRLAGAMRRQGADEDAILAALREQNKQCAPPLDDKELQTVARSGAHYEPDVNVQRLLNDERPKVQLPGNDRLMSDVATELAAHLWDDLFTHNREVVCVDGDRLHVVGTQEFRTLVEKTVVGYNALSSGLKYATMSDNTASGLLASPQLREGLRSVAHVNTVRLPVMRANGHVELLPKGYDEATQTLTICEVEYADNMPFAKAVKVIRDLFGEFTFDDRSRSQSVAVSALLGMYAAQIVPQGSTRPVFVVRKNAEGAGATLLMACCVVPVLGNMPTGSKVNDEELRKLIVATLREGGRVLILDNAKGRLDSEVLEAFTSSITWTGRVLGSTESIVMRNNVTVFCTSNGATLSPDMRRRTLLIELHLLAERAEDRVFKRELSEAKLKEKRPELLAACWAILRNWIEKQRPQPSRQHTSFPAWARMMGGIVEAAGFGCPLDTPEGPDDADEDGDAMRVLVEKMEDRKEYSFKEIASLCYGEGVFMGMVGAGVVGMSPAQTSAFGYMLKRYDRRRVGGAQFFITGKGHARRFYAEALDAAAKTRAGSVRTVRSGRVIKFTSEGRKTHMGKGDLRKTRVKSV